MFPRGTLMMALTLFITLSGPGEVPARADDTDGDGIQNDIDVCNNTPAGTAVDGAGRPLGDVDMDCDADLDDHALFQQGFTGPLAAPPGMVLVSGGSFQMGDPWAEGDADERPVHAVHLSPFCIDACEVTNQQYAAGLNWAWGQGELIAVIGGVVYQTGTGTAYPYGSTTSAPPDYPDNGRSSRITWDGSTFGVVPGRESHPVLVVSWYGAVAYCNWRSVMAGREPCFDLSSWACDFSKNGFRLPTEAEWEKAAGWDPVQQRHFRFGEHTDGCGYACLDGQRANYASSGDPFESGPYSWTTPVGYYNGLDQGGYQTQDARSYYGCRDMSGNAWEWCYDWYSGTYYAGSPSSNPTGPASGTYRVLRGGAWCLDPSVSRTAYRRDTIVPSHRGTCSSFRGVVGTP